MPYHCQIGEGIMRCSYKGVLSMSVFLRVLIFQKLFLLHPLTSVAAKVNSENKVDAERQVIDQGKD